MSPRAVKEDYERAEKFSGQIDSAPYADVKITPHWLPQSDGFWYHRKHAPERSEFIYVDIAKSERKRAFDHEKLAKALADATEEEADPQGLPFTWIDMDDDGSTIRFNIRDKSFEYDNESGSLESSKGPLNLQSRNLKALSEEIPSESSDEKARITFINRTDKHLSLFWLDFEQNPKKYGDIEPEKSWDQRTYVTHVWKLVDKAKTTVACFVADSGDKQAVIDETTQQPSSKKDAGRPKGKAFIRDSNVFVRDEDGQETRITYEGNPENAFNEDRIYTTSDGKLAIIWQINPEQERLVTLVESSPEDQLQPKIKTKQYLKPGDRVAVERPRLFDLEGRKEIATSDALFQIPYTLINWGWCEGDNEYQFLFNERGHQILRLIGINRNGDVRTLIEEKSDTFINYSSKIDLRYVSGTKDILWTSERDGWTHIYLYDTETGKLKNQVTKGEWVIRAIDRIDADKQQIWFKGLGMIAEQDPYYAHLARVNFDGTGLQILTEGDGTHTWHWSPNNKHFLDTWSRVDMAPISVLRDADTGKALIHLEKGDLAPLIKTGWSAPERFCAAGRDGTTPIYGIITKPSTFDPNKTYPVLENIYAGPHGFFCPKSFNNLTKQHELAELGFIIVQIDGMGTNWRSKRFHDVCYKNIRDAGFPDRIAWLRKAAESRPWMDLSKVGIYGVSAGGQSALAALLWHGDFYKAAVSDCGCHDNRMDKLWWNEAWMGWPVDKSYEDNSNAVHAERLKGKLMLMVGEMDTNVDPSSTMQVVNALNKAMKDYELVFFPGGEHGAGLSSAYGVRRMKDFFVRHLLGVEPPERNAEASETSEEPKKSEED